MLDWITKKIEYIIRYKQFTYLISIFMAFYLAEVYPQSKTPLPQILGLFFQNQMLRLLLLIVIIYVSQYNYYLASIITIIVISSYMLSDKWNSVAIEGFSQTLKHNKKHKHINNANDANDENDIENDDSSDNANDDSNTIDVDHDDKKQSVKKNKKTVENYRDEDDDEDDKFIDLDDGLNSNKIHEKYKKIANDSKNTTEYKEINKCIDVISKMSDGEDIYRDLLRNVGVQRAAYLKYIKDITNAKELEKAKLQYHRMLGVIVAKVYNKLKESFNDDDEEDDEDDDE
jgi:hypothetical protein